MVSSPDDSYFFLTTLRLGSGCSSLSELPYESRILSVLQREAAADPVLRVEYMDDYALLLSFLFLSISRLEALHFIVSGLCTREYVVE